MGYIAKRANDLVGKKVKLTELKDSFTGYFEVGSVVTITGIDFYRGYTFSDDEGHRVIEAGFDGFEILS